MAADNNIINPLIPRDKTAAILEQTFGNGDTISVDPDNNTDAAIGLAMCEKILESSAEKTVDDHDASTAAVDYTGATAAASTPLRAAMEKFRIVDIERPAEMPGIRELERSLGDDNSAAEMDVSKAQGDAGTAANKSVEKGDAGSTNSNNSDDNSARSVSGDVNPAVNSEGEAVTAVRNQVAAAAAAADAVVYPSVSAYQAESGNKGTKPSDNPKVPSMVKPPIMPPPPPPSPIEVDAIASSTYKAIMAGRSVKNTPSTLRGTGRANANTDCGTFYNKGDNRVSHSVYK
jgi:hypothetical protein